MEDNLKNKNKAQPQKYERWPKKNIMEEDLKKIKMEDNLKHN
jgi:hypothetical protein